MDRHVIDLRSDTVTRPCGVMRKAMAGAEVGDDVYGDDPTVNRLQELAAERMGTEAALFLPSGTQSNLCALLAHCQRGDEYIVGQTAHTYRYEGGGAAIVGGIQPQPLEFSEDGTLDLARAESCIKPDDPHFARTRLLCLENTQNGRVLPLDYLAAARAFVERYGLGLHLDGARVFNASVRQSVPVTDITRCADSVSVCLSKGLGAPVGSLLCGARPFIQQAHRWRKVLGGGMRQAGVLAVAGIIALTRNVDRLADDHVNAAMLAEGLSGIDELQVDPAGAQTNMVFAGVRRDLLPILRSRLAERGILVGASGPDRIRLVTHLDVRETDIRTVVGGFKDVLRTLATPRRAEA
jgi:threonine aldolase